MASIETVGKLRVTLAVATVLKVFLEDPAEPRYGYDLMHQTGYPSGMLYPILSRLRRAGWVTPDHDRPHEPTTSGPGRRMYRLTSAGTTAARDELAALGAQLRFSPPAVSPSVASDEAPAETTRG